jgi:ChrB-like protein
MQPRLHLSCHNRWVPRPRTRWVLLAYRLPRQPSTPRSALWRKLRRLGAVQVLDGLAALPLDARNREQLEWLADEVLEAGGEATIWVGELASARQERELAGRMADGVAEEYVALIADAAVAREDRTGQRRRTLGRLRRELRRIKARDYFPPPEREQAEQVLQELAIEVEEPVR